ncbi:MAG: hypothetical protein PHP45_01815 [Elusimicrobiales bacterium]|nr:hypothetical protein [Elusimicrobiales bacterium]
MKRAALSLVITLASAACVFARELPPVSGARVEYEADTASYDRSSGTFLLDGHVVITERDRPGKLPDRRLRGETFSITPSSGVIVSTGAVLVEEGGSAMFGSRGRFNWHNREGELDSVNATIGSWRIPYARHAEVVGDKNIFTSVTATSCDEPKPDYKFKFSTLTVVPGDYLLGWNALFYLGKIPVFYLPVVYKPLGEDSTFVTYLDMGYDNRSGIFAKTTTVFRRSRPLLAKLYLDYFGKLSWGTGGEIGYNKPDSVRSDLSFYRIHEPGSDQDRWGAAGGWWYKLKDEMTCPGCDGAMYFTQGQLRLVSDPQFNNDFFRSNPYSISNDRNASGALVRQTAFATERISYIRNWQANADKTKFFETLQSRPRFDFQTAPLSGPLPFLNTFTGYYDSVRTNTTDFYLQTANARWTAQKSIPLARRISLFTSTFYDQTVLISPQSGDGGYQNNQATGRYGAGANLRRVVFNGYVDLGYSYIRRLKTNTWSVDARAADTGEESNLASLRYYYRPTTAVYFQMSSAYDLHNSPSLKWTADDRLQPILAETGWQMSRSVYMFARDVYKKGQGNQAFVTQMDFGLPLGNSTSLGLSNYASNPDVYMLNQSATWYPKDASWHLDAGLNWAVFTRGSLGNVRTMAVAAKTLTIYKDFHDFHTEVNFQLRPGVKTASIKLNLLFNPTGKRVISPEEDEKFWRPWQKPGDPRG